MSFRYWDPTSSWTQTHGTEILISTLAMFNNKSYFFSLKKERKKKKGRIAPLMRQEGSEIAFLCFFPGRTLSTLRTVYHSLPCPPLWKCCCSQARGDSLPVGRRACQALQAEETCLDGDRFWEQCALTLWDGAMFSPEIGHFCLVCGNPVALGKGKPAPEASR